MPHVIKMDMRQWNGYMQKLGARYMDAARRGLVSGAMRCIPYLQTRTSQAKAASPRGTTGALDTGLYKAAWRSASVHNGSKVFNMRSYAAVIEKGRRRRKKVGRAGRVNLEAWAKRKLKLNDKEARSAAFAIAKKIEQRGLDAREVMMGDEKRLVKLVEEEMLRELDLELGKK